MQITIDFELDLEDFADIVDAAGYAIGYWADEAEYVEPYHETDPEATYTVWCEGVKYILKKENFESAIIFISEGKIDVSHNVKSYILNAIKHDDMGEIDAYAADAITQVACFGEVIYG